ncbi:MAG: hypothetical protein H0T42_30260, partial [Deltaproteobacteria bacterium]|nr:hypothetical protein [Deltaproteobacteria bacterium]
MPCSVMRWVALGYCLAAALAGCDWVLGIQERLPIDAPPPLPPQWIAVAAGTAHTCAVGVDNSLWCWGENARGQSGQPDTIEELTVPTRVGDRLWTTVASSYDHSCAIDDAKAVWCWGANSQNAIGATTSVDHMAPTRVLEDATAVATGNSHTCAIRTDETLWCWGRNFESELALPASPNEPAPRQILTDRRWKKVAAGLFHTCGITTDGDLLCWGENLNQQVAIGGAANYEVPQPIEPGTDWIDVALHPLGTCAVRADGRLRCQGFNNHAQLGAITQGGVLVDPVPTGELGRTWTRVFASADQTCALRDDLSLWCFGNNAQHALGFAAPNDLAQPMRVAGGSEAWRHAAVGGRHLCALGADGALWCAGTDGAGQLGSGTGGSKVAHTQVPGTWRNVAVGSRSVCARDQDGAVWCWGANNAGQLGDGTYVAKQRPEYIVTGVVDRPLALGTDHTCAQTEGADPVIRCWGLNGAGQLGNGTSSNSDPSVKRVTTLSHPLQLAAGTHTCAVTTGDILNCWGSNSKGQLGFMPPPDPRTPYPNPVLLPAT